LPCLLGILLCPGNMTRFQPHNFDSMNGGKVRYEELEVSETELRKNRGIK